MRRCKRCGYTYHKVCPVCGAKRGSGAKWWLLVTVVLVVVALDRLG